jgi:hypothetical protein
MVEYKWGLRNCPKCNKHYNMHVESIFWKIKVENRLGPQKIRCSSCLSVFDSGLVEWPDMARKEKVCFGFLSLLYALIFGWIFTLPTVEVIGLITRNSDKMFSSTSLLLTCVLVYSFLIMFFQIFRVILSNERAENQIQEPMEVSFLTWQTNLHFYGLLSGLFSILLYFIIGFIIH